MSRKRRLDETLVERGLVENRSKARALILAGKVRVDDQVAIKAGFSVDSTSTVEIEAPPPYVSRGGYKLARALDEFHIDPGGAVCADFGASTGGFTDVLLKRGADKVYAVDVGYGQLDWKLRQDPRVVVMERTNARYLTELPQPIDLVVIDVSFISLSLMFPVVAKVLKPGGKVISLIKPQFEAGRGHVGKGGVVRDPDVHRRVIHAVCDAAVANRLAPHNVTVSPITGPAGNSEFLFLAGRDDDVPSIDPDIIDNAIAAVGMRASDESGESE